MFLDKHGPGPGWLLNLSNYELNLLIKSLDDNIELSERDEDSLDRYLKILYGVRKQKTMRTHRGYCAVCQQKLNAHEAHEHPRNPNPPKEDDFVFLSRDGYGWKLNLSDYNLDLLIKSLSDDDGIELTDEQNSKLDRVLHILFGVRRAEMNPAADSRKGPAPKTEIAEPITAEKA